MYVRAIELLSETKVLVNVIENLMCHVAVTVETKILPSKNPEIGLWRELFSHVFTIRIHFRASRAPDKLPGQPLARDRLENRDQKTCGTHQHRAAPRRLPLLAPVAAIALSAAAQ